MENLLEYEAMAKLKLSDTEREWVCAEADNLIESFSELEKIQTEEVQPLVTVLDIQNVLREDISSKMVSREYLLENAPEQYDGYFQVPKTLE